MRYVVDVLHILDREALAAAMQVSTQAVGQLIRGETKTLKPINLVRAAKRIGVTVEQLVVEDLRALDDGHGVFKESSRIADNHADYQAPITAPLMISARNATTVLPQDVLTSLAATLDSLVTAFQARGGPKSSA